MYMIESRSKEILKEWDRAVALFQDFRDEVEAAIQRYEEIKRLYDDACYDLREAEERINELEEEVQKVQK